MSQSNSLPAILAFLFCVIFGQAVADSAAERDPSRLTADHLFSIGEVTDPRVSPEGDWIAYTVTRSDPEEDEQRGQVWMAPVAGGEAVPLTAPDENSSQPRWSPDGRYLAFLSARDDKVARVWRLSRQGGEAVPLTDTPQAVQSFTWSPDSKRMLLVLRDASAAEKAAFEQGDAYEEKTAPPWVIDREQFKTDYVGYLDRRRTHVHVLDVGTGSLTQLTQGDYDDLEPAWSPDGTQVAFVSNRTVEPDLSYDTDIWVVSADPQAQTQEPRRVSDTEGADTSPSWSPDGRSIVHASVADAKAMLYATLQLAVSDATGAGTRFLAPQLDRMVFSPRFSADGRHVWFMLEDAGEQHLARISSNGGRVERVVGGEQVVHAFDINRKDVLTLLISKPALPPEVFLLDSRKAEQRSFTNRNIFANLKLGTVEKVAFHSADGTPIEGFAIKPVGFVEGRRYPTILDIHGGPQSQYDYSFNFKAQLFAANGYLVLHPNPRGSTGYGQAFCQAIWRDWGGPDYEDVMAAVDDGIARGWADPDRLGVTGWSYGGMLTNHVITRTDRFKAAATGASAALYVVNYGHDMYQRWWEQELGLPWEPEAREIYERMSPLNRVDQVTTPTLILGGEIDWNVPIINSEQLYLALRRLGVETQLVVYPGEYHGIDTPSHARDLYGRYLDWFGRHLGVE